MHIFLLLTSGILSQRCFTVHIAKAGDNFISPCATSLHRFPLFLVSRRSYCDAQLRDLLLSNQISDNNSFHFYQYLGCLLCGSP